MVTKERKVRKRRMRRGTTIFYCVHLSENKSPINSVERGDVCFGCTHLWDFFYCKNRKKKAPRGQSLAKLLRVRPGCSTKNIKERAVQAFKNLGFENIKANIVCLFWLFS